MKELTASAVAPRLIVQLLATNRAGQEEIYREAGLDPALIDNIDRRIACEDFQRFAEVAAGKSDNPHVGLNAISSFFPSVFDVVSFTMLASTTLMRALEALVKYSPLIDESVEVTLRRDETVISLVARRRLGRPRPIVIDTGVAVVLRILRLLAAGRPVNLHAAQFSFPAPRQVELHAEVLGCTDITFGARDDAISFRIADLDHPIPRPSSIVSTLLNELADSQLEFLSRASLVSIKAREVIARGIGGSPPTLSSAAAALRMTPRTLQRALEREGVSFRQLVDDTQRQHAHSRLRYSSRSIKEIAFELGFKEQRSLHRASVRWFGMPPAAYRHYVKTSSNGAA
ncbi:AraC family transcriptional regulator [Albidovulum sp.]|uniref:AraC family transcriptional regulator n=1 Tax=Albidovulum sp. TaxID=1872424 RepID=UPI0039B9C8AA